MTDFEIYQRARREGFQCAMSLAKAIQEAGGTVPLAEEIGKMTMDEFITKLAAQNGIRFVYHSMRETSYEPKPGP